MNKWSTAFISIFLIQKRQVLRYTPWSPVPPSDVFSNPNRGEWKIAGSTYYPFAHLLLPASVSISETKEPWSKGFCRLSSESHSRNHLLRIPVSENS